MAAMQGWDVIPAGGFDVILAHAVMDLAPIANMAARVQQRLAPAGLFYTTINYDGGTTLFPPFEIMDLEDRILSDVRPVDGSTFGFRRTHGGCTIRPPAVCRTQPEPLGNPCFRQFGLEHHPTTGPATAVKMRSVYPALLSMILE
ncbi:MAG: hypothetical protein MZV65_00590 [Chromatiales bacterium]|nr:hypothetical protein [Chromatiales bacterium]